MKLESLRKLFVEDLQDLYSSENQILEALLRLIEKATAPEWCRLFTPALLC